MVTCTWAAASLDHDPSTTMNKSATLTRKCSIVGTGSWLTSANPSSSSRRFRITVVVLDHQPDASSATGQPGPETRPGCPVSADGDYLPVVRLTVHWVASSEYWPWDMATMRGRQRFMVLVCFIALSLFGGGTPSASGPSLLNAQGASAQVLGPSDAIISAVAVSPYWPADGTILAVRSAQRDFRSDLVRSGDGGRTWERLPGPEQDEFAPWRTGIPYFGFAPTDGEARTLFLMSPSAGPRTVLYRSEDRGSRWTNVLELERTGRPGSSEGSGQTEHRLILSPAFAVDQIALVVAAGSMYRSTDGGVSWQKVSFVDRPVMSAAFSPDFRVDRTVFVSTQFDDHRRDEATDAVLISTDGGETWTASARGLEVEPNRYGTVAAITVSPTLAVDATVYAVATAFAPGCRPPSRCRWDSHVVRSHDRGQSWEPVLQLQDASASSGFRYGQGIALSADYATDGFALVNAPHLAGSGAIGGCSVFRTRDGGDTWAGGTISSAVSGSGGRCEGLTLYGGEDGLAFVFVGGQAGSPSRYSIGGESWTGFSVDSVPLEITDRQRLSIDLTMVPLVPDPGANRLLRGEVSEPQRRTVISTPTTLTLFVGGVNGISVITYQRGP
jgi:photosystem II stability/assembly factor-like uncharacterized protein